jgi:hypothetical protein
VKSKQAQNTKIGFLASVVAQRPFQKIFIDYVGTLPRTKAGNSMLLVFVDAFSKFVWLISVREATSAITIKALRQRIFSAFAVPEIIVSDKAKCFVSHVFRNFCFNLGIRHVTTTPYYPQPSHAERFNRNLRSALIAYNADSQEWDENLDWLQVAFNTAVHKSTNNTPFQIMFPFRAGTPLANKWTIQDLLPCKASSRELRRVWHAVRDHLRKSHQRSAKKCNQGRKPNI